MNTVLKIIGLFLVIGIYAISAWAIPSMMNYQGAMVDSNGVPANGIFSITFSIWDDPFLTSPVNRLWSETQGSVEITDGLFDVLLGSVNPITRQVFDNDSVWLEVKVGANPAMAPRQRIATVAYAFHAAFADTAAVVLGGGGVSYALVYTVAQSGGDYTSVAAAITAIPGSTGPYLIRVMPGTYNEPAFSIPNNVTLRGAGRDCTFLIVNAGITMNQPNAMLTGFTIESRVVISAADITVSDNDITNPQGDAITIDGGGIKPIIHDCKIHNCEGWGITAQNGAQPFIHDNCIFENSSGGVLYNVAGGSLSNNKINNHFGGPGVQLTGMICPPYTLVIDDNQIQSNSVGISSQWDCYDPRIMGNDISYNFNAGIELVLGHAHIVANTIGSNFQGIYLNNPGGEQTPPHIIGNNIWANQYGIDCANGAKGIVSSNLMAPNFFQDINYPGMNPNVTFNNNTFDTTVGAPSAPGLYNVTSTGTAINP
ncbi:right-handed parallel beta-helix repeat-containing protein [bacterium]|nr:right-handed parallel beta-helix repeat-containing protein [bacterium]MBU1937356.1 right-handed parallel beta-helix repeat-containing protein [bacterium]